MDRAVAWVAFALVAVMLVLAARWLLRRKHTVPVDSGERLTPSKSPPGVQVQLQATSRRDGASAPPTQTPLPNHAEEVAELRRNLRRKTLGSETTIDRLIQAERDRQPGASEVQCYRRVVERWEDDNR